MAVRCMNGTLGLNRSVAKKIPTVRAQACSFLSFSATCAQKSAKAVCNSLVVRRGRLKERVDWIDFRGVGIVSPSTDSPFSSRQVSSPATPMSFLICFCPERANCQAVCRPICSSLAALFLPMPQTSRRFVSSSAFCRFSCVSIRQQPWYPLCFLANLLASLASVLVGASPTLTGMPVHCSTICESRQPNA